MWRTGAEVHLPSGGCAEDEASVAFYHSFKKLRVATRKISILLPVLVSVS